MEPTALATAALSIASKLPLGAVKHRFRNRQRETAREILEGPIPATVILPEYPSIEFVTPRRISLKAILTGEELPKAKHRGCRCVALLETLDENRIMLLDAPENRNQHSRHGSHQYHHHRHHYHRHHRDPVCEKILGTDLALGVDLKKWKGDPMLVPKASNPDRIQAIIYQCRWIEPNTPWPLEWVRQTLDHHGYEETGRQRLQETSWALCRAGQTLTSSSPDDSLSYPLYVILETDEGLYQPLERGIMITDLLTDPCLPRSGERTLQWQGQATRSWRDAVTQLFRRHNWNARPIESWFGGYYPQDFPE